MEKQRVLLKSTAAACSCELHCDVCNHLDLWSNTGFMTHPKALWRRNTKRCPSVAFKIGNILDIFLCVHWHRSHHCAPTVFIIGQKKKKRKSPIHPSALLILLGGSVVDGRLFFLERDIFRCFEVCCQGLPSNTGADRRKSTGGIPLLGCCSVHTQRLLLPLCQRQSKSFGENQSKMHQPSSGRASWDTCVHSKGLAQPLLGMVPVLMSNNQNIINYCWFLNT